MPTPAHKRNYRAEAARETPARKQARRDRKNARYAYEKENGPLPTDTHVHHKKPLSRGGTNAPSNLKAVPRQKNESFRRDGPGGKPKSRS